MPMTPQEQLEQLRVLRDEFNKTYSALLWGNPQNTRTTTAFDEAYGKLIDDIYNKKLEALNQ